MVNFKTVRQDFDTVRKNLGDPRKLGLGEFPQGTPKGTVPLGDGWYATPDTPADPQDCDRYPDSPWCGGNPISSKPVDLDIDAEVHGCGFDIEVTGAIGFIKVPPAKLSYRFEGECRNEPPPWTPPPPPGFFPGMPPPETPFPGGIGDDEMVVVGIAYNYYGYRAEFGTQQHPETAVASTTANTVGASFSYPGTAIAHYYGHADMPAFASISFGRNFVSTANDEWKRRNGDLTSTYTFQDTFNLHPQQETNGTGVVKYVSRAYNNDSNNSSWMYEQDAAIYWGRYADVKAAFKEDAYYENRSDSVGATTTILTPSVVGIYVVPSPHNGQPRTPYDRNPPPPPPERPPTDKDCCMSCCPDYSSLLRQLLAEIKKANKAIGSDELPASLPKVLNKDDNSNVSVENLAQLWKRGVAYLDGISGEYPIKIKIQDTDATEEGDQSQEMVFDNAAEMLAEQFGINMNTSINTELMIQMHSKTLVELAVTRKQLHNTQSAVKTLQDYFGFDCRESPEEIPLSITVPQSDKIGEFSMDQFLKESKQKVEVWKLEKSEIGAHKKRFLLLEKAASIIQAVFWRKLSSSDVKEAMMKLLNKQHQTINDVDKHQVELETWLEQFENGFTSQEGYVGDISKPWGDDYENRPKTKIIGKPKADVVDPDPKPPTQH